MRCVVKPQLKRYGFPVVWELAFIITYIVLPETVKTLNLFLLFYLGICIYFYKDFSFHRYFKCFNKFKKFWLPIVVTTAVGIIMTMIKMRLMGMGLIDLSDMYAMTRRNTPVAEALFGITTIFFQPIAEELFFRKAIMEFDDKKTTILTFVLGLLLCAFSNSYMPVGLLVAVIFALPYAFSYLYSRNVYVPITAHIIVMAYQNLPNVIYDLARISMQ